MGNISREAVPFRNSQPMPGNGCLPTTVQDSPVRLSLRMALIKMLSGVKMVVHINYALRIRLTDTLGLQFPL